MKFLWQNILATASAIDAGIQNKIHDSGTKTLIISNKEMNDIIKLVQAFEDSNISLEGGIFKHVIRYARS